MPLHYMKKQTLKQTSNVLSHAISCLACLYIVTDWALLVFGSRSVPLVIGARTSDLDLPPVPPSRSTRLLT